MNKNSFSLIVLTIIFFTISSILFGFSIKYFKEGGKSFIFLRDYVYAIAEIPRPIFYMVRSGSLNPNKLFLLKKHKDKKKLEKFLSNDKRDALLVLARYDHSLSRSVVDVVNLNNFEVIHTYAHDIAKMNKKIKNRKIFTDFEISSSPIRFQYHHPIILEDGSLISNNPSSPIFKIDFCSNLIWINDEERFHHSKMLDHEGNILVSGQMPSVSSKNKYSLKGYRNDSVVKVNPEGQIIYNKSITGILIENKILPENFIMNSIFAKISDPIHSNDIEPAFSDTEYWNKGDIFISIRNQSAIVHYRPSNNKVLNYITGPFIHQHDVDIISDKEISLFNNASDKNYSEILIYNFETKKFKTLINNELQNENFKTDTEGLHHIFKDGSLLVDESNHGRIILFNNKGEKEWEFVNKDKNGDIGLIKWSRVIEDKLFIEKYKLLTKNRSCLN